MYTSAENISARARGTGMGRKEGEGNLFGRDQREMSGKDIFNKTKTGGGGGGGGG